MKESFNNQPQLNLLKVPQAKIPEVPLLFLVWVASTLICPVEPVFLEIGPGAHKLLKAQSLPQTKLLPHLFAAKTFPPVLKLKVQLGIAQVLSPALSMLSSLAHSNKTIVEILP